ncbi:MAG TPA: L-serine ammonia-lyase, partial [Pseudobdellovibrionaceae bacterium]|nr:L-serine ammonia-lyase [Pseudobdellovibrionaceae bacterium]
MGPMKAAFVFLRELEEDGLFESIAGVRVSLYGSLALTGIGHGTDRALLAGLSGRSPDSIDPAELEPLVSSIKTDQRIKLLDRKEIVFDFSKDLVWHRNQNLPRHPNGMKFEAFDSEKETIRDKNFYSIGGGFIVDDRAEDHVPAGENRPVPFPFGSGENLLLLGQKSGLKIWQMILENEKTLRSERDIRDGILRIWEVMRSCIERGFRHSGTLPGGMKVKRRAPDLVKSLTARGDQDPLSVLDWVNAAAISVNEENAAFGRVVTAPTNGAAGIIPAVIFYIERFLPDSSEEQIFRFFLTASAIGTLYKINASISGAEVGCQGEVGVASSM